MSKIFCCPRAFLFWTTLFTIQSLAGTWKPFWYEAISCAKEFDLFISIWGNSWNVLPSLCLSLPLYLFVTFLLFFQLMVPTLPFLLVASLELLYTNCAQCYTFSFISHIICSFSFNQCVHVHPVSGGLGPHL